MDSKLVGETGCHSPGRHAKSQGQCSSMWKVSVCSPVKRLSSPPGVVCTWSSGLCLHTTYEENHDSCPVLRRLLMTTDNRGHETTSKATWRTEPKECVHHKRTPVFFLLLGREGAAAPWVGFLGLEGQLPGRPPSTAQMKGQQQAPRVPDGSLLH